jgi:hypothetical protein
MFFWLVFSPSFSDFRSQIYTFSSTSAWHTPPQPCSVSSSAPATASTSCVSCRWSACGPLWCAWEPCSAFFRPYTVARGSTVLDLRLGDKYYMRRRTATLASFPHCRRFVLGVSTCLCLCYSLVSPVTACLCLDQFLWEYLLANC